MECNNEILGTATLLNTNIRAVYVDPLHQRRNIGKMLIRELEKRALLEKLTTLDLEASFASRKFWESLGYVVQKVDCLPVPNIQKSIYYKMAKTL